MSEQCEPCCADLTTWFCIAATVAIHTAAVQAAKPGDFLKIVPICDGDPTTDDRGWTNTNINAKMRIRHLPLKCNK